MPLTNCPECDHRVSTAAEACPSCGHPLRPDDDAGPTCYACRAEATTRCQSCGTFSCPRHLQNTYVQRGNSGSNELRCESCYNSAQMWKALGCVLVAVFAVIFFLTMGR